MQFTTEVNYTINIHTIYGNYYFIKESIYNNIDGWEPTYEETKSDFVYKIFTERYTVLKNLKRSDIKITRCWSVSHYDNLDNKEYDLNHDNFVTGCYNNWIKEMNNKL